MHAPRGKEIISYGKFYNMKDLKDFEMLIRFPKIISSHCFKRDSRARSINTRRHVLRISNAIFRLLDYDPCLQYYRPSRTYSIVRIANWIRALKTSTEVRRVVRWSQTSSRVSVAHSTITAHRHTVYLLFPVRAGTNIVILKSRHVFRNENNKREI